MILALLACTAPENTLTDPDVLTLTLDADHRPLIAKATVTATESVTPWIELWSDDVAPLRTVDLETGTSATLDVQGLRQDHTYEMVAVALLDDGTRVESAPVSFTTGSVDMAGVADWQVLTGADLDDGAITLFAPNVQPADTGPYVFGVDRAGELVWAFTPSWNHSLKGTRAPRMLDDGSFTLLRDDALFTVSPGGQVVETLPLELRWLAHHDGVLLPDDQALILGREERNLYVPDQGGTVPARVDTLLRVDTAGELLWQWSLFDVLDHDAFPTPDSQEPWEGGPVEWTHSNALEVYGETALLSVRNHNQLVLVDLETGELIWTFGENGDFELLKGAWFEMQHAPLLLDEDTILLYDNRAEAPGVTSRMVVYDIDTDAMTASQVRGWDVGYHTVNMGDVDPLPDDGVLVTAAGNRSPEVFGHIFELDADDRVVWNLEIQTATATFASEQVYWLTPVQ